MALYSVADAKAGLPRLIDRALEVEEVVITRYGKVVAEIRSVRAGPTEAGAATYEWLRAQRVGRPGLDLTSVKLLEELYDERSE